MKDLKARTIRGGVARLVAQATTFIVRIGSLLVLARLLEPKDFGLVGMVTAFTGVLNLFRDFGLSSATVQRSDVTEDQVSTLFWINLLVGACLALVTVAAAPALAAFYQEPRLLAVTVVLGAGFIFNAAGVQHGVRLQRDLRFMALAVINTVSLLVGSGIAVASAVAGYGYWALVSMTISVPLISTIGCWLATLWVPGRPHRGIGIISMMRFGGTLTLNGLVMYAATNFDKVLLGRFWGADALGIYGRAYQLISIPTENLNTAAGEVAFPVLSRLQHDPERFKSYFVKGYSLLLALTIPATIACGVFADDLIIVLLGRKWVSVAPIFQLLAPTMLVFAILNPLGWLLTSLGLVERGLKIALFIAPVMIAAYTIGLPNGPIGVAFACSVAVLLCGLPVIAWAVRDTMISMRDVLLVASRPLTSSALAALGGLGVGSVCGQLAPLLRLVAEGTTFVAIFAGMILFVMGQKALYLDLLRASRTSSVTGTDLSSPIETAT